MEGPRTGQGEQEPRESGEGDDTTLGLLAVIDILDEIKGQNVVPCVSTAVSRRPPLLSPRPNPRPAREPSPTKVVSSTTNLETPVNTLDELGSYIVGCKSSPCHRAGKQGCKVQESCGGLLESYVLTTRCNIIGMSYRRLTFVINAIPIRFLTC